MTCDGIRQSLYEYHRGWCGPDEAAAIQGHLEKCPSCLDEQRGTESALALLKTLPDLEPTPDPWKRIEEQITPVPTPARRPVFATWLRVAAAACVVVALASFVVLATMSRTGALPVVAETGKALSWNEAFTAEQFTTLALSDVGTLKLNQGTTLRFKNSLTCVLESGDLFADILPSGKGFSVVSGETTVSVQGTRFGVTAPSTVYVVEGRVSIRSPQGRFELSPRQVAVGPKLMNVEPGDYLHWLVRHERPEVRLRLDPRERTTITPGSPLKWHLILETDSVAPLYLGTLRDVSQLFSLLVDGMPISLDPNSTRALEATPASNGLLRLDVSHPYVLECSVDPGLFSRKGRVEVRARFVSGDHAPDKAWKGFLESEKITVEVK